ncbi:MAG: radical SAM protein [Nitrospina sp.]|nr:radical SAM protein [Nitrospina sp.]
MFKAYFADLSHTAQGVMSKIFPIGVATVAAYAHQELGEQLEIKLFKLPEELNKELCSGIPDFLCLSNYAWNLQIANAFAKAVKKKKPKTVVVLGGPNFPDSEEERCIFLKKYSSIDFYIVGEGEEGFVNLFKKLKAFEMNSAQLKKQREKIQNCAYLLDEELIIGETKRIDDLNRVPCPYQTGMLDPFFSMPLVPIVETARGCPFQCTFCADGKMAANRVFRYHEERVTETLEYIASRVNGCDELIIADLNFGMYDQDISTANTIARLQNEKGYPLALKASAGKNKPDKIINITKILKGSGFLGAALQSTDPGVLKAIKRSNIPPEKILNLAKFGKSQGNPTYTEVILGLPDDSREKHFESLRVGVDMGLNSIRMYQLMLLAGTEMASPETRKTYEMIVKWRILPGCAGIYKILGEEYCIAEYEEIVVGNKTLPFNDYLECRLMNLLIETFINNALFEEVFGMIHALGLARFDFLEYILDHPETYPETIRSYFESYIADTKGDLFESEEEVRAFSQEEENIKKYIIGSSGRNELLYHKALCYLSFEDLNQMLYSVTKMFLLEKGKMTDETTNYLKNLERFSLLRKRSFKDTHLEYVETFEYDFKFISEINFEIDPGQIKRCDPLTFRIKHNQDQISLIQNALNIYGESTAGLARLIQRNNLKLMFRGFEYN